MSDTPALPIQLPIQHPALIILHQLQLHGFKAYIVGGAVRDLLRQVTNSQQKSSNVISHYFDYDFTTDATPEQIQSLFENSFYENTFGTVSVAFSHLQEQFAISYNPPPPTSSDPFNTSLQTKKIIDIANATKIHDSLSNDPLLHEQGSTSAKPPNPDQYIPVYEITTFRSEDNYTDHRRPEHISWGTTLLEDLSRRDFTCNAMAIEIPQEELTRILKSETNLSTWITPVCQYTLHDPYNGMTHLKQGELHTVGTAFQRFDEDALRMLRAIRFSVQLGLQLNPEIIDAITLKANDIKHISWERIATEWMKMLASTKPADAVRLLDQTGLLQYILPELLTAKGVEQAGHHTTDVWTHSLDALAFCPSPDPIVRFATLLHDIGKPATFKKQNGTITFYNHDIIGSRIAKKIAQRFRLSKKECDRIFILVRYHMFHYQEHNTDASIRRFMRKVGLEHIDDILDLREGDRLGSGARKTSWRLEEMKQRMIEQLHQPMEIKDLAISGNDLIETLQVQPGPLLGSILQSLFEEVLDDSSLNTKEYLLNKARELLNNEASYNATHEN